MANIPLQSISFPGLSDKYTTPVVDNTLTQAGAAADAKKTGDEIGAIKNDLNQFPNGTYPNMSVGNADQLTATVGIEDNTPYLFRTSGGSVDIGDREDVRKIVGGTIVNNQLVGAYSVANATQTIADGVVTITPENNQNRYRANKDLNTNGIYVTNNHVYLMSVVIKSDGEHEVGFQNFANPGVLNATDKTASSAWTTLSVINKCTNSGIGYIQLASLQVSEYAIKENSFIVRDLTQAFGTSIADYVYSLETATAGAGVAWLKKHFPKQFDAGYQAYDAGSLQSVSGLTAHKMIGFNAYDNTTGKANVVGGNVYQITGTYTGLSLDGEAVTPDASGYFTPAISGELTVTGGNSTNTCVHLVWDGERDGEYEPYKEYTYPLDDSLTLRGIPKLDTNNQLYYDGDEYLPDGTVNRRYGIVDLGTLTWTFVASDSLDAGGYFTALINGYAAYGKNAICSKYEYSNLNGLSYNISMRGRTIDKLAFSDSNIAGNSIYIIDSSYSTGSSFKTAMSGVYLVYELATPTTETADPYQETQIVDDFGTEEFVLADGAFPVPVGHDTMYQNNLRAKLEMSPDSPDGDGLYVVQQENGQNEYVPLASTSTIQDILTRLTALENA